MLKTILAAAIAAAFALTAQAEGNKAQDKSASGSTAQSNDGGAAAMFKSLDKNNDGSISKDEAKGTPHEKDFAKHDKNSDGKLSSQEHAAAMQQGSGSTGSASSGASAPATGGGSGGGKKY